jgi:acetyl-CoA C-acetyltransferase
MNWNRKVAIVGIGRTHATSRRTDVNQNEMNHEAVVEALNDAGLSPKDIEMNLMTDMELFQGDNHSDMWQVKCTGGHMKPSIRMTTGGTTGGMIISSAAYYIASGMVDVAMVVGFQKHDEGNATTGLASIFDPLWDGKFASGFGGRMAMTFIEEYGERVETMAAQVRAQISEGASRNEYAHLRNLVTVEDVMKSPMISYPQRVLHLCPQSNGACCLILASEEKAKQISKKPVWIKDFVTSHNMSLTTGQNYFRGPGNTWYEAPARLFKRNNITNPREQLDLIEFYNPTVWNTIDMIMAALDIGYDELQAMLDNGDIAYDGAFPISPSGGVLCTNPIGAAAMLRTAEAALQIRGDCGAYQVHKEVNTAMATSFGGSAWTICHLLTKSCDW